MHSWVDSWALQNSILIIFFIYKKREDRFLWDGLFILLLSKMWQYNKIIFLTNNKKKQKWAVFIDNIKYLCYNKNWQNILFLLCENVKRSKADAENKNTNAG